MNARSTQILPEHRGGIRPGATGLFAALVMLLACPVHAANLTLGSVEAAPGESVVLEMLMTPGEGQVVSALQFDVSFPQGSVTLNGAAVGPVAVNANKSLSTYSLAPGVLRGLLFGNNRNAIEAGVVVTLTFTIASNASGIHAIALSNVVLSSPNGTSVPVSVTSGTISTTVDTSPHDTDVDGDFRISIDELLRVIQFYNSDGLHCMTGTEDGFSPGQGDQGCAHYDLDYAPVDWYISIDELVRGIQLYNSAGYIRNPAGEDGFVPL